VTPEGVRALLAFLPIFERRGFVPDRGRNAVIHAPEVVAFIQVAYLAGFVEPFDWPAWEARALRYFDKPELLRTARLATLRKLMCLHIRKDRFSEGHLAGMIKAGHIQAILRRLGALTT